MPDEDSPKSYMSWIESIDSFDISSSVSEVTGVRTSLNGAGCYIITIEDGTELKVTAAHKALVLRNSEVRWLGISNLVHGDKFLDNNYEWKEITDIGIEVGLHKVYNINVEENDVYYAQNYLMHNKG